MVAEVAAEVVVAVVVGAVEVVEGVAVLVLVFTGPLAVWDS